MDRLENIKKHASGNGSSQCVLCADSFGMLSASPVLCVDCQKVDFQWNQSFAQDSILVGLQ